MLLLAIGLLSQDLGVPNEPRQQVRHVAALVERGDSARLTRLRLAAPGDRLAALAAATSARLTYRYPDAERLYAGIIGSGPAPPDRITLYALLGIAQARLVAAPYDSAIAAFERAASTAQALGDSAAWVEALLGSASARARFDRPAAALPDLVLARRLLPPDSLTLGAALTCTRAAVLVQALDPKAKTAAREGIALARKVGDARREGFCLRVLGSHYAYAGEIGAALAALDSALALQRVLHDRVELANTLRWRGWIKLNWHDYPAADRDLSAALVESEASGLQASIGWTLRHQAAMAWRFGDLTGALQLLDSAEVILQRQRDGWGLVSARGLRGDVAMDAGQPRNAEAGFRAQVEFGERMNRPIETYTGLLGLLQLKMRQGDWERAAHDLAALRTFVRTHGQPGWNAPLQYEAGLIALRRGETDAAWQHFAGYLRTIDTTDHLALHAVHTRRSELLLTRQDVGGASRELTLASSELDRFRDALRDDRLRLLAFQSRQAYDDDAGFATVIAGLAAAGRVEDALRFAERRRARMLSDRLRDMKARRDETPRDFSTRFSALLPDSTALLFISGGRRGQPSTLFLLEPKGIAVATAPAMERLDSLSRAFTSLLGSGTLASTPGHRLRHELLDTLLSRISPDITRLVIVPDGELFRLPFDALPLPDGAPLVTRYAVSLAPSIAVAAAPWAREAANLAVGIHSPADTGFRALALGDPTFPPLEEPDSSDPAREYREAFREAGGLPRLEASATEVRAVAQFAPGADIRLGENASEAWLKHARLEQYRLIHIASHAVVSERRATRTSLALAPGGNEDGFLSATELADLGLRADLVVLSACRTAGGVVIGGEGIQGLTAPLLEAGARAVLATEWQIGDRAAARFTERFYRAMASGEDAGGALRSAKLASFGSGAPPKEWAAFVLVGDATVRLPLTPPRPTRSYLVLGIAALGTLLGYGVMRRRRGADFTVAPSSSRASTHQFNSPGGS